jgi:hypothetical protein
MKKQNSIKMVPTAEKKPTKKEELEKKRFNNHIRRKENIYSYLWS